MISPTPAILTHTADLDTVTYNVKTVRAIAGVSKFMAVIKVDGYSQGAL